MTTPSPSAAVAVGSGSSTSDDLESFLTSPSSLSPASIFGLLTSSPLALRPAVLDYYATLIDNCAGMHFNSALKNNFAANLPNLRYFGSHFEPLVCGSATWASLMAQWALAVLGELSSKYADKISRLANPGGGSGGYHSSGSSLNATLPLWLDCSAIALLVDLVRKSIDSLLLDPKNSDKTEVVVSILLEASSRHAPHYDWVVAHIGGCFPETVINRVLAVGLKDFASSAASQMKKDGKFNLTKVPKVNSVVNILGHLAAGDSNASAIRKSISAMAVQSLKKPLKDARDTDVGTVPYILNLCSLDASLIPSLTVNLYRSAVSSCTDDEFDSKTEEEEEEDLLVERVAEFFDKWEDKYFPGDNSLLDLVIHLIIQSNNHGRDVLRLLLDLGADFDEDDGDSGEDEGGAYLDVSVDVRTGARTLLDVLAAELIVTVHAAPRHGDSEIPFLEDLCANFDYFLHKYFLSKDLFQRRAMQQLANVASLYRGRTVAVRVVKHCLDKAQSEEELGLLFEFLRDTELWVSNIVKEAVTQRLKSRSGKPLPFLKNLGLIVHYQSYPREEQKIRLVSQFAPVITERHSDLLPYLSRNLLVPHVLKIFKHAPVDSAKVSVSELHRISHCLVHTIFLLLKNDACAENGLSPTERNKSLAACGKILMNIASNQVGLPIVLRFMMDGALNSEFAALFGGKFSAPSSKEDATLRKTVRLMDENLKFGSLPTPSLGSATAFHAGVIGEGKRPLPRQGRLTPDEVEYNQFAWLSVLFKICHGTGTRERSKEACKQLALLLVELVSPDVMYNGFPWPDDDFVKVTMERDLIIAQRFDAHPLIWKILRGLAEARPSLCYTSVLLRAQMAVQMNFWQACVACKARERPRQLTSLKTLLEVMSIGQFLPHPLDSLSDVVGVMHSFHVHCVLVDVWNFMRDNVPSPVGFASNADGAVFRDFEPYKNYKQYCERLRVILIEHIDEIPREFKRFFVDEAHKQEANLKLAMEY